MNRYMTICCLLMSAMIHGQNLPDTSFHFTIQDPLFEKGKGPVVGIDEAHNNRHSMTTGLAPITELLQQDGFVVKRSTTSFTSAALSEFDVLIIVNPLHSSNLKNWTLPCPSAFSESEIEVLKEWVLDGGSLFLSADHMPYGGAVQVLATEFNVEWANCFDQTKKKRWPPAIFSRKDQMLVPGSLTDSSEFTFQIDRIGTFTGSAFKADSLNPFLKFDASYELLFPEVAWQFSKKTRKENAAEWLQGAYGKFGDGKVVFMGESAMFTAQLRKKTEIGMNSRDIPQNKLLAINIFRFLALD